MNDPDDLFTLRQEFWVGNYQGALAEASGLTRLGGSLGEEKAEFVYRAHIGLKEYDVVLRDIQDSAPLGLRSVRLLALYEANPAERESIVTTFQGLLNDSESANNATVQLVAGIVLLREGHVKDALRTLRHGLTLEQRALRAMILLRMDRVDHAQKELRLMQEHDEDATLTQLTAAWVDLHLGGPSFREAELSFQDLITKCGQSVTLLNGLAVAYMHQGKYEEADKTLIQAVQLDATNADTLINLISTAQHLHKAPETVNKLISQLQRVAPDHPYVHTLATLDHAFERVASQYLQQIVQA